jgi:fibrillarin-like pre-rRNA processing protein
MGIRPDERFKGIYWAEVGQGERPLTKNLAPGTSVYGEGLIRQDGEEYRVWDPFRSKLSAALMNGIKRMPIAPGRAVLYLGAASGTTVSHVSDVVGEGGLVFAVEVSPRVARELYERVVKHRKNVIPIIEDARRPMHYASVYRLVDVIYCDIAQQDETEIALLNASYYLEERGYLLLAVKARSIDAVKRAEQIFGEEEAKLVDAGFEVEERVRLEPYDKEHLLLVARRS